MKDLVIGIDASTSAVKAIAWNRQGEPLAQGRCAIPLHSPAPDWYEQDPEDWWQATCAALRELAQKVDPGRFAAVAVSNQRETFVPLTSEGAPVRPAIVWLDQRCGEEVTWLSGCVGEERIHRISGKPVDMAPVAYRIAWMLRHEPESFRRTAMFADVHSYLVWRLTGAFRTSWASADPMGLFDMEAKEWSPAILDALQLDAGRLPELHPPAGILGAVSEQAANATLLAKDTVVVAGGGDGQAAGLGVNALTSSRSYLNLGTAVVSGIYSKEYRTGMAWRTMGGCSEEDYYYETSLRSGTFLLDWFVKNACRLPAGVEKPYAWLEAEAAKIAPGSQGLLAVPYWGAVMTPYWDGDAKGCIIGLTGAHQPGHIYRALLEGIAMEQAMVTGMIEQETGLRVDEFVAIGGGSESDVWCQIIADTLGRPVKRSSTVEASSLGAAMCACGWGRLVPQHWRGGRGHGRPDCS